MAHKRRLVLGYFHYIPLVKYLSIISPKSFPLNKLSGKVCIRQIFVTSSEYNLNASITSFQHLRKSRIKTFVAIGRPIQVVRYENVLFTSLSCNSTFAHRNRENPGDSVAHLSVAWRKKRLTIRQVQYLLVCQEKELQWV